MGTTWNPSDHGSSAEFSLSGGNLIASATSSVVFAGVRGTTSKASGKWYIEFGCVGMNNSGAMVGLANSTPDVNSGTGDTNNILGLQGSNGNFIIAFEGSMGAGVDGQTMRLAIDFGAGRYWIAYGAGLWNADAGADPAAGTNGKVFNGDSGFANIPTPLFPWAFFDFASGTITLIPSGFGFSIPSGFTGWDGGAPPPINSFSTVIM